MSFLNRLYKVSICECLELKNLNSTDRMVNRVTTFSDLRPLLLHHDLEHTAATSDH